MVRILVLHVLATVAIDSSFVAVWSLQRIIARVEFHASDWQSLLITAALPTLMATAIFWNELLRRLSLPKYLAVYAVVGLLPIGCTAFVQDYSQLLVLHVVAALGAAGWIPVKGVLLKRYYSDAVRGRALAVLTAATLLGGSGFAFVLGAWLDRDGEAFRRIYPGLMVLQLAGLGVLVLMTRRGDGWGVLEASAMRWGDTIRPILRMRAVLREDRTFARYELAFMTYGVGWMICDALLPVLATDRLRMTYGEFASSTSVVQQLSTLAMVLPAGLLMDRIGPARVSALAFGWLILYPLGLALADSAQVVALSTVVFGMSMAGVQQGWMLGPVSLAGSQARVSEYVAIHTTLVGLRGAVFQWVGMFLYVQSSNFALPFMVAALAFAWSARQMWTLRGDVEIRSPAPRRVAVTQAAATRE